MKKLLDCQKNISKYYLYGKEGGKFICPRVKKSGKLVINCSPGSPGSRSSLYYGINSKDANTKYWCRLQNKLNDIFRTATFLGERYNRIVPLPENFIKIQRIVDWYSYLHCSDEDLRRAAKETESFCGSISEEHKEVISKYCDELFDDVKKTLVNWREYQSIY